LICQCRDGRVVNARALRARGPSGPHGFESHSRRLFTTKFNVICCLGSEDVIIVLEAQSSLTRTLPCPLSAHTFLIALHSSTYRTLSNHLSRCALSCNRFSV